MRRLIQDKKGMKIEDLSKEEQKEYISYLNEMTCQRDSLKKAQNEGRKEGKLEVAVKMKALGMPIAIIAECTGLSTEEIEKLGEK